jgi:hypothetical protein
MTGVEAAEKAADKTKKAASRPRTPLRKEASEEPVEESQSGTTIYLRPLKLRTPERVRPPLEVYPEVSLEASPEASPEEPEGSKLPASTAPGRIEGGSPEAGGRPKRRRIANQYYRNS